MSAIFQPSPAALAKDFTANLAQAAATYDLATVAGTTGGIWVERVTIYVATVGATFTSVSIQTNQTNPVTIMSALEGAVANLIAQKLVTIALIVPFYLAVGQKIQYTIVGATGTGSLIVSPKYMPTVLGNTLA